MGFAGGIGTFVVGRSLTETGLSDTETGAAAGLQLEDMINVAEIKNVTAKVLTPIFYTLMPVANYALDV